MANRTKIEEKRIDVEMRGVEKRRKDVGRW